MIKVLIVDDSALMRNILKDIISSFPNFRIVGFAKNGEEAIELNRLLKPDLITMDIEMPKMNGIEAVKRIMHDQPTRIVMVSAFASEDASPSLKALRNGALDIIQKPSGVISPNLRIIKNEILNKLKEIAMIPLEKINAINEKTLKKITLRKNINIKDKCIVIAASTGGPKALDKLIPTISSNLNAYIFLVQHMPATFTKSFAQRLNRISEINVKEVEEGEELKKNVIYVAKGDNHFKVKVDNDKIYAKLTKEPPLWGVRPSADYLFDSAGQIFKENTMGIVLTGMGKDATQGSSVIKEYHGKIVIQDKKSAFIWGMPGSVYQSGYADYVSELCEIPRFIKSFIEGTL